MDNQLHLILNPQKAENVLVGERDEKMVITVVSERDYTYHFIFDSFRYSAEARASYQDKNGGVRTLNTRKRAATRKRAERRAIKQIRKDYQYLTSGITNKQIREVPLG